MYLCYVRVCAYVGLYMVIDFDSFRRRKLNFVTILIGGFHIRFPDRSERTLRFSWIMFFEHKNIFFTQSQSEFPSTNSTV